MKKPAPLSADTDPDADLAARRCAWVALDGVIIRGLTMDAALESAPGLAQLETRDRGFARLLLATALRRRGALLALLAKLIDKPLAGQPGKISDSGRSVENLLALGLTQLLHLDTPAHAAVDTAVRLVALSPFPGLKGLVNAVLRRVAREKQSLLAGLDEPRIDVPDHLWRAWCRAYGEAAALAIAEAHMREPPLDLTVSADAVGWAEKLGAEILPGGSLRLREAGAIDKLAGFDQAAWWVQDAAAAIPARLLGDVRGKTVADLCAAPGGKTLQLLAAGAQVTAVDRSPQRLARLHANLARLKIAEGRVDIATIDASQWQPRKRFDALLIDAPCSSTGTLRRRPDVAWSKSLADIARLVDLQRRLLARAGDFLLPNARLVYCVCSLQQEEGEDQIAWLLATDKRLVLDPVLPAEMPGLEEALRPDGTVRILPSMWETRGGIDGFYIARLKCV